MQQSCEHLFEVGGRNKTFNQVGSQPNAFLALDDIELSISNKIPLWLFGFLYWFQEFLLQMAKPFFFCNFESALEVWSELHEFLKKA